MSQRQVWIAAAVLFGFLCAVGVTGTIWRDYANTYAALASDTRTLVRLMETHAEQGLANTARTLERAAELVAAVDRAAGPHEDLRSRLDDLVLSNSAIGTLWAVGPDGVRWINNNDARPPPNRLWDEPYFAIHRDGGAGVHVGPTAIGTVRQRPRFTVSRPVRGAGTGFEGVVVAGVDVRFFEQIYERIQAGDGAAMMAFNGVGDLLAAAGPQDAAMVERARRATVAGPGAPAVTDAGGWLLAASRLADVPVLLVAGRNVDAALAEWRGRSLRLAGLGGLMVAGFAMLTMQGLSAVRREASARTDLVAANERLEERVRERTQTVELLFRELNHRVKNNLQIVASLLRLQIRKTDDAATRAILQDSVNRVFAIADVHGEIENAKSGSVSLRSYVGKIVTRICEAMAKPDQTIDTRVDVADAELALDRAVLIAIAINEAVTNAFKHAFADRSEGRLDISVSASDGRLVLVVRNDVAQISPAPPSTTGSGLGSSIIGMLVQQMAGSYEVDTSDGYTVRMAVPLA